MIASALVETIAGKVGKEFNIRSTCKGSELLGKRYRPPFDYYYKTLGEAKGKLKDGGTQPIAWRVVAADFVTTDSGTGVVHQAPAFGEVDYDVLLAEQARFVDGEGPELICAVGPDGKFTDDAPDYEGPLGQGSRQRPFAATSRRGHAVPPGAVSSRLSRSAGGPTTIR